MGIVTYHSWAERNQIWGTAYGRARVGYDAHAGSRAGLRMGRRVKGWAGALALDGIDAPLIVGALIAAAGCWLEEPTLPGAPP